MENRISHLFAITTVEEDAMWMNKYFGLLMTQIEETGEKIEEGGEKQDDHIEKLNNELLPELRESLSLLLNGMGK